MKVKTRLTPLLEPHWLFITVATIFGLLFVMFTPPLWGQDEPSHVYRVYGIVYEGQVLPPGDAPTFVPSNLHLLGDATIGDLVDNSTSKMFSRRDIDDSGRYAALVNQHFAIGRTAAPSSSAYSPISYLGAVMGFWSARVIGADIGTHLHMARIGSLAVYVLIMTLALYILRQYSVKWLLFFIALLPTTIFQASAVNADSILIALSLLYTSIALRMLLDERAATSRSLTILFCAIALLLPLVKPNYAVLSLFIFLIPIGVFSKKYKNQILKVSVVVLSMAIAGFWALVARAIDTKDFVQRPDGIAINPGSQIDFILHSPLSLVAILLRTLFYNGDTYITQTTALMGWNYIVAPLLVVFILCTIAFFAAIIAKREVDSIRGKLVLMSAVSAIGMVGVFSILYISFTPTQAPTVQGVQGRYLLPFIVPLVLLLGSLVPFRIQIRKELLPYVFGVGMTGCLAISFWVFTQLTY